MSTPTQLWAHISSKELALISFTLVLYDHAITFAEEINFFWTGPWSASKTLYLSIRYLAVTQVFLVLFAGIKSLSPLAANQLFVVDYLLAFVVMVLCQCVVTLRVWHLFHRSHFIRWLAAAVFIGSMIGTAIVGGISFHDVKNAYEITNSSANSNGSPPVIFTIYLPSLIVHTVMFSLTTYRFRATSGALQEHGIVHRFLKEGMFMYAFAAGTLLYEIISLSMTKPDNISIYYPALGGGLAVGTTVVSVCRAMLSIRSLAATHHVDPVWLLNHAELSRVPWRRGASEGEIYVEVDGLDVFPVDPTDSL